MSVRRMCKRCGKLKTRIVLRVSDWPKTASARERVVATALCRPCLRLEESAAARLGRTREDRERA